MISQEYVSVPMSLTHNTLVTPRQSILVLIPTIADRFLHKHRMGPCYAARDIKHRQKVAKIEVTEAVKVPINNINHEIHNFASHGFHPMLPLYARFTLLPTLL